MRERWFVRLLSTAHHISLVTANTYIRTGLSHAIKLRDVYRTSGEKKQLAAAWSGVGPMKIRQEHSGPTEIIRSLEELRNAVGDHPVFEQFKTSLKNNSSSIPQAAGAGAAPGQHSSQGAEGQETEPAAGQRKAPEAGTPTSGGASIRTRAAGSGPASSASTRVTPQGIHSSGRSGRSRSCSRQQ